MSGQPDLQTQKPYALDRLVQLQGQILQLSQGMVIQRARIEKFRQTDLAVARDTYNELQRTRTTLVDALAESQLFLMGVVADEKPTEDTQMFFRTGRCVRVIMCCLAIRSFLP